MQLVAYGAQDIYLTGQPQITFYKSVYRRHTNFAVESIQQTINGSVAAGARVSVTISRNGDLLKNVWIQYNPQQLLSGVSNDVVAANGDLGGTEAGQAAGAIPGDEAVVAHDHVLARVGINDTVATDAGQDDIARTAGAGIEFRQRVGRAGALDEHRRDRGAGVHEVTECPTIGATYEIHQAVAIEVRHRRHAAIADINAIERVGRAQKLGEHRHCGRAGVAEGAQDAVVRTQHQVQGAAAIRIERREDAPKILVGRLEAHLPDVKHEL